jgi:hypothetical protein
MAAWMRMRSIITLWRPGITRWLVVEAGEDAGSLGCPSGGRFSPGDHVNLPRRPRLSSSPDPGVVWRVAAVEEAEGWDGRLILEDPRPRNSS